MTSNILTTTDLEIMLDESDGTTLVRLRGRLRIDTSPALRDRLLEILRRPSPKSIVVDLSGVSYIDASGIATLVEGLKIALQDQSTLRLNGLQGRVLHLFEVTGLLTLFETNSSQGASSASRVS